MECIRNLDQCGGFYRIIFKQYVLHFLRGDVRTVVNDDLFFRPQNQKYP